MPRNCARAAGIVLPRHINTDAAVVRLDSRLYSNTGSNKARLKDTISQRGNITIDSSNNEIVIGDQVNEVEVVATVMAEQLATYLFIIVQRKKQGAGYEQITHSLNAPHQGYAGATISATIPVVRGDRISVLHDCTGQIRGQYSQIAVRATR